MLKNTILLIQSLFLVVKKSTNIEGLQNQVNHWTFFKHDVDLKTNRNRAVELKGIFEVSNNYSFYTNFYVIVKCFSRNCYETYHLMKGNKRYST